MAHAHRPALPTAASLSALSARARALVGAALRVTYPYVLGGLVGYLALTVVSRDVALMFAGALLVLYGAALSKALQGQGQTGAHERGADGAP